MRWYKKQRIHWMIQYSKLNIFSFGIHIDYPNFRYIDIHCFGFIFTFGKDIVPDDYPYKARWSSRERWQQ